MTAPATQAAPGTFLDQMLTAYGPTMSQAQVAGALHVTEKTLETWRSRGTHSIPFAKIGRKPVYMTADIAAYIERQMTRQTGVEEAGE